MTEDQLKAMFQRIEDHFNEAVVSNDVERIKACTSEDWVLVDARAGIIPLSRFLHVVEEGVLSHQTMTKEILRVRAYGDTAVVTGRGRNTGVFRGEPMGADEWVTDVYRKAGEEWVCTLTHLTPVEQPS